MSKRHSDAWSNYMGLLDTLGIQELAILNQIIRKWFYMNSNRGIDNEL